MIRRDPVFLRGLLQILEGECALHERYLKLLEQEQRAVMAANMDAVNRYSAEREKLNIAIQTAQDKRLAFMAKYPQGNEIKLTEWIESHTHPADRAMLRPVVERLRELIKRGHSRTQDLSQLLSFSLGLLGGCISIIWSATRGVFRSYGSNGNVKESSHPIRSRKQITLRQA